METISALKPYLKIITLQIFLVLIAQFDYVMLIKFGK